MKKLLSIFVLCIFTLGWAQLGAVKTVTSKTQVNVIDTIPDGWKKGGTANIIFNQSAFSNWAAGGVSNIAGNININYDANYKKGDWTWDNRIMLSYGLTKNENQDFRKTDDRIELNSLIGKKAFGNWSYSLFGNIRTQFTDGYHYDEDVNTEYRTSGFFSPAYLTFGPGLLWKQSDNLKFNFAPLTSKITFIGDDIWKYDPENPISNAEGFVNNDQVSLFGVEPGKNSRYELGFYASGYYKFQIMENVSMENILALYSNYLDEPKNIDLDYTMNLAMQINKYLSTMLTFQTVYDDNAFKGFQIREVFGLGITANF